MPKKMPDLDWDDVLNKFKGVEVSGCRAEAHELEIAFKNGRKFTLRGDGQKHVYSVDGEAAGRLVSVSPTGCSICESDGKHVAKYTAEVVTDGGTLKITANRTTDDRPAGGIRFKLLSDKQNPKPSPKGKKPVMSVRIG